MAKIDSKTVRFVRNDTLEDLNPAYRGNIYRAGQYYNSLEFEPQATKEVLRWMLSVNPQRKEKRMDSFRLECRDCSRQLQMDIDQVIWLGHASFFISLNGVRILTDPCFGKILTTQRRVALPCAADSLTKIDVVLISHNHRDHLDIPSLKRIAAQNPNCIVLTPLGFERLLQKNGLHRFLTAGWYQRFDCVVPRDISICLLPANHWSKRNGPDYNTMLWGGFWIQRHDRSVFFAGDTAAGDHFTEIRQVMGKPSVALMPIGAYKPEYLMKRHHLNPEDAIVAANQLGAQTLIPMHYGTYDLSDEPPGEPIRWFRKLIGEGRLDGKAAELAVGQQYLLT
ncbi:MAG: MBL fold metallo-hydrolase [Deltaproteobacteria bacterium]|nr:MBL fold metallo-hydrolase [Deltaproteobacteria bacterium]